MYDEKKDNLSSKEKLAETLHNKSPLSSLRTYQGDTAKFIKEKNESVVSVAIKEKARKEKVEEETKKEQETEQIPRPKKESLQINMTILLSSLLLIVGGITAFFYVFEAIKNTPSDPIFIQPRELITYNSVITLVGVTRETLGPELKRLAPTSGIRVVKISDANGEPIARIQDFFDFLEISPPAALRRNLNDDYVIGTISQNNESSLFIIITANDFGVTFSSMLNWESNLLQDLFFLNEEKALDLSLSPTATPSTVNIQNPLVWKDAIVKNRDTRVLMDEKYDAKIAYTFLDKNTVLITNNIFIIEDLFLAYASRPFPR